MKVYLAGPIRFSKDYGKTWRKELKEKYTQIEWKDPLERTDYSDEKILDYNDSIEIVESDLSLIDESDCLLVNWEEEVPTCGTPMEVRYAYSNNIPVVVKSSLDSISPWMIYHSDAVVDTFEEAIRKIGKVL